MLNLEKLESELNTKDVYKLVADNALERFLLCLDDMINLLSTEPYEYDLAMWLASIDTMIEYIKICYKEKSKYDKSLSRKDIREFKKNVLNRETTLVDCYQNIFNKYI